MTDSRALDSSTEAPTGAVPVARRTFLSDLASACAGTPVLLGVVKIGDALAQDAPAGTYDPSEHWYGIGIDVQKCIGCARCVVACKTENDVPPEPHFFNTWIERYVIRNDGEVEVESPNGGIDGFPPIEDPASVRRTFFVPKLCNQCENPPCVQVCPVGATFITEDGVILVDEEYCIGCRYCIQACPYGARYMHPDRHVAAKCTFCYHRLRRDRLPACVEICPTGARVFGELTDRPTPLARFMRFNDLQVLKPNLNTKPKAFYANMDYEVS
jgi:Fe-S-cluster-containing dehydrogenase component